MLTDEASYLREYELLTLARLHNAEPEVNDLLARLVHAAEAQQRMGSVLDILLTQALAYAAQGNHLQALATLARALTLAEPEGYRRSFVDEGEEMRSLLLDFSVASERKPGAGSCWAMSKICWRHLHPLRPPPPSRRAAGSNRDGRAAERA